MQTIGSLSEYLDLVRNLEPPDQWLFRGVSDSSFQLVPSIGRVRHKSIDTVVTRKEEERALWRFRDHVRPYIGLQVANDLEWMVVAQHHGLPTRLLDWSRSPLVALYFAVTTIEARQTPDGRALIHGRVDVICRPPRVSEAERRQPFSVTKVKMIDPPHVSERITRQAGILTLHPTPQQAWEPRDRQSFIVHNKSKFDIKKELDRLGVNHETLFPGVDATAEYIRWQLKWDRLDYGDPSPS